VLVRTHRTQRPGGGFAVVNEFWEMVDHSPLRNGIDWLPGGRRYALQSGEPVRAVDEITFQLVATGEILRLLN
jgi:hypothetical protein